MEMMRKKQKIKKNLCQRKSLEGGWQQTIIDDGLWLTENIGILVNGFGDDLAFYCKGWVVLYRILSLWWGFGWTHNTRLGYHFPAFEVEICGLYDEWLWTLPQQMAMHGGKRRKTVGFLLRRV